MEDDEMDYDYELVLLAGALDRAKEAYYKHLSDESVDGAYYPLVEMVADISNSDFNGLLRELRFKDLEFSKEEESK